LPNLLRSLASLNRICGIVSRFLQVPAGFGSSAVTLAGPCVLWLRILSCSLYITGALYIAIGVPFFRLNRFNDLARCSVSFNRNLEFNTPYFFKKS